MGSKPWSFRPKSTLIKDGGCGKSQGSKLISEESGAPVTKTDVESTPEAEYTHISGGQSPPGPSQAKVQPRSRVQGPTSVRSGSQTLRHNTGSGEQSPRVCPVASRRAALSLTLAYLR